MECDVCLIEWDNSIRIPRILSCGHSICEVCLISMFKKSKSNELFCPACMQKQKEVHEESDIKKLIKNVCLLRITEKIESGKCSFTQSSFLTKELNLSFLNKTNASNMIDKNGAMIIEDLTCKTHGLPLHSYATNTNKPLCDLCMKEVRVKTLPLPNYISEAKRKINSSEIKINLLRQEIERLDMFFKSYQKEFDEFSCEKIDDLFEYLEKLILYNHTTANTIFQQCKKEQESQIETKLNEMKSLMEELAVYEKKLKELNESSDNQIVDSHLNINEIYNKVQNFMNYELELNLFQMRINIKDAIKEQLFQVIQNSYDIDVEFAKFKGETPLIRHILQKDQVWQCVCGEFQNKIGNIICIACGAYRKLESYDNLIQCPLFASKEELKELFNRRKSEVKEFQNLYQTKHESSVNINKDIGKFYALDLEWFLLWKCFVTNDLTDKYINNSKKRLSCNKFIGNLPPGPINNGNISELVSGDLFDKTYTVKKGLKKNHDYISISEPLWNFFYKNYGGGPELITKDKNKLLEIPKCASKKEGLISDNLTFERRVSYDAGLKGSKSEDEKYEDVNSFEEKREQKEEIPKQVCIECSPIESNNSPNGEIDAFADRKYDANNTILNETASNINPITNYNFSTKFSEFKNTLGNQPSYQKSKSSYDISDLIGSKKMRILLESISSPHVNNQK